MFYQSALIASAFLFCNSLAQVSDGFENGWDQTTWPTYAPDCNQGGVVSLDSTVAHTGKNSLKVQSASGYCGHIFFGTTKVPSGDLYVRTWLLTDTPLGSDHVSFITMPDASQGANEHIRIGGQSDIMMFNRQTDDATLPDLSPQGIASSTALPTGAWQCFEYYFGTDGTIQTWLNGAEIPGLTIGPGVSNPNSQGWTKDTTVSKLTGVYFGWESYSGEVNTYWYDDVVIASNRTGCSAGGTTGPTSVSSAKSTSFSTRTTSVSSSGSPSTSSTSTAPTGTSGSGGCSVAIYGQCGGQGYTGCTNCASGSTCKAGNAYYSQCL